MLNQLSCQKKPRYEYNAGIFTFSSVKINILICGEKEEVNYKRKEGWMVWRK
jgi:hypothetical protein